MKCPVDQVDLVMAERQGVEIDYCPTCRGVWLDRGELDKILDRAASLTPSAPAAAAPPAPTPAPRREPTPPPRYDEPRRYDDSRRDPRYYDEHGYPRKKKKESWLGDLLDFG